MTTKDETTPHLELVRAITQELYKHHRDVTCNDDFAHEMLEMVKERTRRDHVGFESLNEVKRAMVVYDVLMTAVLHAEVELIEAYDERAEEAEEAPAQIVH
jgi:hypothetical protein